MTDRVWIITEEDFNKYLVLGVYTSEEAGMAALTRLETLGHARTGIHTADLYIHDYPLNRLEDWVEERIAARTDD